ncbi:MAG: uncharacterized protein QG670_220 [Thermoproteota archaeon]|nr:uncharacterized protein [Thermoproteota archaeon]
MSTRDVKILETIPVNKIKYCIIGVPDVGLVGAIAAGYIIRSQKMTEIGHLESDIFPPVIVVHDGDLKSPFRIYKKDDLAIIISEIPLDPRVLPQTSRSIIDWVESKNVELLVTITGIGVQNRMEIEVPAVFGVGNTSSVKELFAKGEVKPFEEGFMAGFHALIARESGKKGIPNLVLLAQSHFQYPDPAAAVSIIDVLKKLLGLDVDTKELLNEAEEIRLKTRELMHRTSQSMEGMGKGQEQEIPMMYV